MNIVPVEIAVSLMMIHGRIETHHIKLNTQIKRNKRYFVDIALEFISSILRSDSRLTRMLATRSPIDSLILFLVDWK
jgi:hypothetical protein